jgi:hypothetical protein
MTDAQSRPSSGGPSLATSRSPSGLGPRPAHPGPRTASRGLRRAPVGPFGSFGSFGSFAQVLAPHPVPTPASVTSDKEHLS